MISRTTARTPPPPPPPLPVSTTVVCSRSVPLSSAMETLPAFPCYVGETNELWRKRFRERLQSMKVGHSLGLLLALASCGPQQQPQQAVNESGAPVLPEASAPP